MIRKSIRFVSVLVLVSSSVAAQEEAAEDASASGSVSFSSDDATSAEVEGDGGEKPYMQRYAPTNGRVEFGAFTGVFFPSARHNLRNNAEHRPYESPTRYMIGSRLGWYPSKYLGIEAEFMHASGRVRNPGSDSELRVDFNAYRGQLVFQLPWSFTPFLLAGAGALQANSRPLGPDTDGAVHFGAGFKIALGQPVALRLEFRENLTDRFNDENEDEITVTELVAWHEEAQLGLAFNLDRPPPAAPPPAPPPDSDGDTVPDMKDECPDVAALTANGCPLDSDGDGVADPDDYCPREKGSKPKGCPDLDPDQDDVLLPCDLCPEEKGIQPDGCPVRDSDGDGILDDKDKCVKEPETKNGFEDGDGCPDEIPKEVKAFTGVIQGIEFDRAKATIRKTSVKTLSKAVDVLKKYPTVRVEISGHTSSEGDAAFNDKLSQERAAAVKDWMVDHGVEPDRIQTRGAGSSEPLADNKSAAGREKNRRIEFKLLE